MNILNRINVIILCLFSTILLADSSIASNTKLPIYNINNKKYISAFEYANINNSKTVYNPQKKKLEILSDTSYNILISEESSFIKINDKMYHLFSPVIYRKHEFLIPAHSFLNIINSITLPIGFIDTAEEYLIMYSKEYNIDNIKITNKTNGAIIQIHTNKKFNEQMISGSITQGGWMNLTIPGGIVDSLSVVNSKTISPVARIRCLQYNESAQISFLMSSEIDEFEITTDDSFIKINLRINIEQNIQKIKEMRNKWLLDTIVIDAGHGGKDPGAIGIGGLQEKTITLDVAQRLGKLLTQNLGVKVVYTRDGDDFIPLWKRTKIANKSGGKVFISLHVNAGKHRASGFETYLLRPGKWDDAIEIVQRENDVIKFEKNKEQYKALADILSQITQNQYIKESEFFASEIQTQLSYVLNIKNRGVKQAGFYVLCELNMPSVLIELGFITNKKDIKLLNKAKYRQKIAEALFRSIVTYKEKYEKPIISK